MKLNNIFRGIVLTAVIGSAVTGCTERIKFGDSFIEKTPVAMLPLIPSSIVQNIPSSS